MYKLGVLLFVCGAFAQHHVTQSVQPAAERQIRLEDIERDGLKSASPSTYQQPQQQIVYQQAQSAAYQQPQAAAYQQPQAAAYQQAQAAAYHQAQAAAASYQQPSALHHPQQQYYQFSPQAYHHQPQLSYSPQYLSGGHPQQLLQHVLLPQAHPYNVPIMLIPYPLQQEVSHLPKARPAYTQHQPQLLTKFRPSPQVQYTNPYNNQVYQQKFAAGVKSTPAPTLKENYDQQQQQQQPSSFNYKLQ